ncbi:MAG: DNA-3-methyladenine glycosylase I [Bryobacteraceae bacterium]
MTKKRTKQRCTWASDDLSVAYHDTEWGVPVHDDRVLFEFLILEGAQDGIVRNRLKIRAAVQNAQSFLAVQKEFGAFDQYIWQFTGGRPLQNRWKEHRQMPAKTAQSDAMSKDLAKRGFKFVGSTICYAFMQATGMVNDHLISCFRYRELK